MIDAHLTYLRASGYSRTTISDAGKLLHRLDAELPQGLPVALPEELAAWLAHDPDWSRQTLATYRLHIVRFYRWATDDSDRWLDYDPSEGLRSIRVPRRLPRPALDEHVRQALQLPAPWGLHCKLAAYAGLRPCEIAIQRREDISADLVVVTHGKGDKSRVVPTDPIVWDAVRRMPPGLVTWRRDGRPVTAEWVSKRTAERLRRRGLPISLYWLRHWFGTNVQAGQGDVRVTQELMGHASPNTTMGYTQVTSRRMRDAVATLPRLVA